MPPPACMHAQTDGKSESIMSPAPSAWRISSKQLKNVKCRHTYTSDTKSSPVLTIATSVECEMTQRTVVWPTMSWTSDQEVAGLIPGRLLLRNDRWQVVHTNVPLSPSSVMWYQRCNSRGRALLMESFLGMSCVNSLCCRMTNYELLHWLVETPSRDVEHYHMFTASRSPGVTL